MDSPRRLTLLFLGFVIALAPSVAHAHGFPWWFGLMVLSPFLFLAVVIAIPCKTGILRLTLLKGSTGLTFRGAMTLMVVDLVVLFFSIWVYGMAERPVRGFLFDLIDSSVGWNTRATFQGTCDNFVALLMGVCVTIFCGAILWFPHYRTIRKRILERTDNPPAITDGRLLFSAFILACVGPGIFWIPACLRLM